MTPESSLRDRVLAATAAQPARTRAAGRSRALVTYGFALALAVSIFVVAGGIAHSLARPWPLTLGIASGAAVLAIIAAAVAWWPGRSMVGRPLVALEGVVIFAPVATFAWLISWHGRYVEPYSRVGWRCLALTLAIGSVLALASLWLRRRTVATHPAWHGAALGIVAGSFGGVLVDLWCPLTNAPHLMLGHIVPVLILGILGWVGGRTVLAVRPR